MGFTSGAEADAWHERARQVERIVDRLRSIGVDRLSRAGADGRSIADHVHEACVALAAASQRITGAVSAEPPRLTDVASGDQFAVIAAELITVGRQAAEQNPLASDQAAAIIDAWLRDLRQRL